MMRTSLIVGIVATVVLVPVFFLMIWSAVESFKEAREFDEQRYLAEGIVSCTLAYVAITPVIIFWLNFR